MEALVGSNLDERSVAPVGRVLPDITTAAKVAVITGDPGRVDVFGAAIGTVNRSWAFRELQVREVETDGQAVIVASHGIGGPGTSMLTEELIDSGITCIIRV